MDSGTAPGESTLSLLTRVRAGDGQAENDLFARFGPALRRWASGRLPRWARDLADTPDLVQDSLLRAFKKLDGFEYRGEGAFQAYLRQVVMNRIREEIRRAGRRPVALPIDSGALHDGPSPLELAIGAEKVARYETALDALDAGDRELVIGRIELGQTYSELAAASGKASPDAARMAVGRALVRLAQEMGGKSGLV